MGLQPAMVVALPQAGALPSPHPSTPADSCSPVDTPRPLIISSHLLPDTLPVYSFSSIVTPSDANYKATPLKRLL